MGIRFGGEADRSRHLEMFLASVLQPSRSFDADTEKLGGRSRSMVC